MNIIAIKVENLNKIYKLYNKPIDRLKESLGFVKGKKYNEYYALNNINIEVRSGETVGIIGTNGSGKSTLLKIITGVLNSTSGIVKVNGRISALLELFHFADLSASDAAVVIISMGTSSGWPGS